MRTPFEVQTFKHGGRVNSLSSNGGTQAANVAMRISGGGSHVRGLGSKVLGFRVQGLDFKVQVFGSFSPLQTEKHAQSPSWV